MLLQGVAKYSMVHGPWTFFREATGTKTSLQQLAATKADGIITQFAGTKQKAQQLMGIGLPTVAIVGLEQGILDGYPNALGIYGDSAAIGRVGAEHLLVRGFKNFAYCGFASLWSVEREEFFCRRIAENGFNAYSYRIKGPIFASSWKRKDRLIARWLHEIPKPVGLMCCNDDVAQEVINACRDSEIRVPEDVAVLGVDNDELACTLCNPPLSSIALNAKSAGYAAACLLDRLMAGNKSSSKMVLLRPTSIITRQSTDTLAIDDREVAEAVNYIHKHAKSAIQVKDVVAASGICRRALQQRFHKITGHSLFDEVRRVRVEYIISLLMETSLPISKIAQQLDFTSEDHVGRYFKREKGMTPQAYRTKYKGCDLP